MNVIHIFSYIGLLIGIGCISFYCGFKYASKHNFIKIAHFGNNSNEAEERRVLMISKESNNDLVCVLDFKYKQYAEQIDRLVNNNADTNN